MTFDYFLERKKIVESKIFESFNLKHKGDQRQKSRIRETMHLSTDADSSPDAIGGWTKANSAQKKTFFCGAILDHFQTKMFKC